MSSPVLRVRHLHQTVSHSEWQVTLEGRPTLRVTVAHTPHLQRTLRAFREHQQTTADWQALARIALGRQTGLYTATLRPGEETVRAYLLTTAGLLEYQMQAATWREVAAQHP